MSLPYGGSHRGFRDEGRPMHYTFKDRNGDLRPDKVRAYVMHEQYEIYRKADLDCDGHLTQGNRSLRS